MPVSRPTASKRPGSIANRLILGTALIAMLCFGVTAAISYREASASLVDASRHTMQSEAQAEALSMRVVDISGGGLAVTVPSDCAVFSLQKRYNAVLSMPDGPDLQISLVVCNMLPQRQPNGIEVKRIGMRFDDLPRGGDSAIQRYIFRIDRQRKARQNGEM